MPVAMLCFWPNYAKIMLVFPIYVTFFKILHSFSKTMANKTKNTFFFIRSLVFLSAIIYNTPHLRQFSLEVNGRFY